MAMVRRRSAGSLPEAAPAGGVGGNAGKAGQEINQIIGKLSLVQLKRDERLAEIAGHVDLADDVIGGEGVARAHQRHQLAGADGAHDRGGIALRPVTPRLPIDPHRKTDPLDVLDDAVD